MSSRISETEREEVEARLRRHQRTPEEVARLVAGRKPFSYTKWIQEAPPATPEELADWEEYLRFLDVEREAELEREVTIYLD